MRIALQLSAYGIGEARYRELEYFCLQYGEKQALLRAVGPGRGWRVGDGGKGGGMPGDPTGEAVARRERLARDVEDIEAAAREAVGGGPDAPMVGWLLRYVTRPDKPLLDQMPCGRRQFFELRRRFFCLLHVKREQAA